MKRKPGRPKTLKAKEVKKPFPMRFSDAELAEFKKAAGRRAMREWMRDSLVMSAGGTPHLTVEKIQEWARANPDMAEKLKEAFLTD